jgi:DNA-binding transcriptional regulator YdaS (Cro superfamily)
MTKDQLAATNKAIEVLGGLSAVADRYNISVQAVQNWRTRGVPPKRVREIANDSGVSRERLLPHLYA